MDIFISYRRQDTSGYALGLRRELTHALPDVRVFLDVESLNAGMNWREVIQQRVEQCDVMLVLIGDEWLVSRAGVSKLDLLDDPVRFELETGLSRQDMGVFPILLEEARMPASWALPEPVRRLCDFMAHPIHDSTYDPDVSALMERLRKMSDDQAETDERHIRPTSKTAPMVIDSSYPSKITQRYLRREVGGMGRDQLLGLIAELLRRNWDYDKVYGEALSYSPLKPPETTPSRVTPSWLAANVSLLSPPRVARLIAELRNRGWADDDLRTHVLSNRQEGLAHPLQQVMGERWVEIYAPLMTLAEQNALVPALRQRGWSDEDIRRHVPLAEPLIVGVERQSASNQRAAGVVA